MLTVRPPAAEAMAELPKGRGARCGPRRQAQPSGGERRRPPSAPHRPTQVCGGAVGKRTGKAVAPCAPREPMLPQRLKRRPVRAPPAPVGQAAHTAIGPCLPLPHAQRRHQGTMVLA